ncbi:glycosyltransferase, partial [Klebsiella pneumoniae]
MKEKLVSVYIPTCNRLEMLKRAIQSVLLQDYKNIEILICDDSSTDGTADYVNELIAEGKNIRYFCTERQSGA